MMSSRTLIDAALASRNGCVDDLAVCAGCGKIVSEDGMSGAGDFDGERFCNEGCEYDAIKALEGDPSSTYSVNDAEY